MADISDELLERLSSHHIALLDHKGRLCSKATHKANIHNLLNELRPGDSLGNGLVVAREEPTAEMLKAGRATYQRSAWDERQQDADAKGHIRSMWHQVYKAMLAAQRDPLPALPEDG